MSPDPWTSIGVEWDYFGNPSRSLIREYVEDADAIQQIFPYGSKWKKAPYETLLKTPAITICDVKIPEREDSIRGYAFCSPTDVPRVTRGRAWALARALVAMDDEMDLGVSDELLEKAETFDPSFVGEVRSRIREIGSL